MYMIAILVFPDEKCSCLFSVVVKNLLTTNSCLSCSLGLGQVKDLVKLRNYIRSVEGKIMLYFNTLLKITL